MGTARGIDRRRFCAVAAAGGAALGMGALADAALADEAPADEAAAAEETTDGSSAAAPAGPALYVVDRVTVAPGDGEAFLADYLEQYVPLAQAVGAELVSTLVAPPCWLPMDSNVLTFTWKVAGVGGAWGIASPLRTPEVTAWWNGVHDRVVEQDRSYFADPADMEVLNNV